VSRAVSKIKVIFMPGTDLNSSRNALIFFSIFIVIKAIKFLRREFTRESRPRGGSRIIHGIFIGGVPAGENVLKTAGKLAKA